MTGYLRFLFTLSFTLLAVNGFSQEIEDLVRREKTKQAPVADAGPDTSICFADSVQIGGNPTGIGGMGPLTFQWTPNGLNSLTAPNPIAKPNMTTIYIVTVTDSAGQSDSDTVTVTVHPNPVASAGPSPNLSPGQSFQIGGNPTASGGTPPYSIMWSPAATLDDPTLENPIASPDSTTIFTVKVTDANGCMASDSVEVEILPLDSCEVEIRYPMDSTLVCNDSVMVIAYFGLTGSEGLVCDINGLFAQVDSAGQFIAMVPLQPGDNEIIAKCVRVDSNNVAVNMCADTISVFSDPTPPICELDSTNFPTITGTISDLESGIVLVEIVEISNRVLKIAGFEFTDVDTIQFAAEDSVSFEVEKIDVSLAGSFTLKGFNAAGCEVLCGHKDTEPPQDSCNVKIRFPTDGESVCNDSITVKATFSPISNQRVICEINAIPAEVDANGNFMATVPLQPGDNEIIAKCVIVDANGAEVTMCADTTSVFSDPTPPICELDYNNYPDINGTITDNESGIVLFEVLELGNRILFMDNVEIAPGESVEFDGETEITFVLKKIDVNETGSFDLNMVNGAGCAIMCDPIDLTLRSEGPFSNFSFALPQRDRWLYVENHGLTRIEFVVNEMLFNLKPTGGLGNEANAYTIPGYGTVGFDLKHVLQAGQNNFRLNSEGPPGSYANILIADYLRNDVGVPEELEFQEVVIPKEFALMQNHPNPFNPSTNIRFNIPDSFTNGIQVKLLIYNLMGQLVKTLVDEHRFPGEYTAQWDGRNQRDEAVSSGIYIYRLVAGDFKLTKRMVFLK